jgi:hypothetical protein
MTADLEKQLAIERERADYAWRNTRVIEAARQDEMRKRDAVEAGNAVLREALMRLREWGGTNGKWHSGIVLDVNDWIAAGMSGPLPELPSWIDERQDHTTGMRE